MRKGIVIACLTFLGWAAASPVGADPRFFGAYCGQGSFEECVRYRVCFLFICRTRTRCETVEARDLRVRVGYRELADDFAVVSGRGTADVEGRRLVFDFGGRVASPGLVRGRLASNFFDVHSGTAQLSPDGMALTVTARGRSLTVRKDRCGNRAPAVTITSPSDGGILGFRESHNFRAAIEDDQEDFPRERMVFRSDRDGVLGHGKVGPRNASLWTDRLSPGSHLITFSATDDGGLAGRDAIRVTVVNRAPDAPTIVQPPPSPATLVATAVTLFEGRAYDREEGPLDGPSLVWELSADGSSFELLGTGRRLEREVREPGEYLLRLTAVDSSGATRSSQQPITVRPYAGNTPPRVSITGVRDLHGWFVPDLLAVRGRGIAVSPEEVLEFTAIAEDSEDRLGELTLEWSVRWIDPPGPATVFGEGTEASVVLEAVAGVTAEAVVTFRAIDRGGLEASSSLTFFVLPAPLI